MPNPITKKEILDFYVFIHDTHSLLFSMDRTVPMFMLAGINNDKNNLSDTLWSIYWMSYFPKNAGYAAPSKVSQGPEQDATYNMIFERIQSITQRLNLPTLEKSQKEDRFVTLWVAIWGLQETLKHTAIYAHAPIYNGAYGTLRYWIHKGGGAKSVIPGALSTAISLLVVIPIVVCDAELGILPSGVGLGIALGAAAVAIALLYLMLKNNDVSLIKYAKNYDSVSRNLVIIDERNPAMKKSMALPDANCLDKNDLCKFKI